MDIRTNTIKQENNKRDDFFRNVQGMFEHRSKLSTMVGEKVIENYKQTYFYLFEKIQKGELPVHENYYGGNVLAENIYRKKYYLKDLDNNLIEEKAEDVFLRIAAHVASVEETQELREKHAEKFYMDLYDGNYLPGGRVIAGSGDLYRLKTLANCFVSVVENDNLESIYKASYEAARTYSYGGGIGIDISQLRPRDSKVHNAADQSTGAVSFMELYSMTTGLIGQSGRRGALMLSIDVKHPDILDFIKVKSDPNWTTNQIMDRLKLADMTDDQLELVKKNVIENTQVRFANISIKVSDEFMASVDEQRVHGNNKILIYMKKNKKGPVAGYNSDNANYSYGMSKKNLKKYEFVEEFDTIEELNSYLIQNGFKTIEKKQLDDINNRDYYGDYVMDCGETCEYDLAIRYSGDYLTYYKSASVGEIKKMHKARDIWNAFIEGNYKTAEPGIIFWSKMSKYSPSNYIGKPIACTNPCGEVPLEDGGACNLGSVNLSRMVKDGFTPEARVDWDLIAKTTKHLVRFLDNVVWWNETLNALEKQRDAAASTRRLGLGVMGIADMFNQLGMAYDSPEALALLEKVLNHIAQISYKVSALLAKEKGAAPAFEFEGYKKNPFYKEIIAEETKDLIKEYGMRNIAVLSIAPTGTISNAITGFRTEKKNYIGVSGGIEPIFALYYTRRSEQMNQGAVYNVFHNTVQAYIDVKGLTEAANGCDEEKLKTLLPKHFFKTAHHISPDMRVKIQGIAQNYIDHSISSTVNLPEDINPEVISDIYLKAWKEGLKGITVYRDGSRYPVLSVKGEETEFQRFQTKNFKITVDEKEVTVKGDEVILTPMGKLTTIYHAKKEGLFN